jgi:hypothetical protein
MAVPVIARRAATDDRTAVVSPPGAGGRVTSIDLVRGVVMILMAIDHVRVYSGLPAGGPNPGIFSRAGLRPSSRLASYSWRARRRTCAVASWQITPRSRGFSSCAARGSCCAERWRGKLVEVVTTFGRVPMFYYLLHVPAFMSLRASFRSCEKDVSIRGCSATTRWRRQRCPTVTRGVWDSCTWCVPFACWSCTSLADGLRASVPHGAFPGLATSNWFRRPTVCAPLVSKPVERLTVKP